jgi:hypothetical protein
VPNPRQTFGTSVVIESSETRTLAWSAVVTDGVTPFALTSADVADPSLSAGEYSPHEFMVHVANVLRASIFARLVADAAVTAEPSAATDLDVQLGFPSANLIEGVGGPLPELWISDDLACSTVNGPVSLVSLTLDNSNGVWSKTGLCTFGESRTFNAANGGITATGRFCPRWFFLFRYARKDSGWQEEIPSLTSEPMGDGSSFVVTEGEEVFYREVVITAQRLAMTGPPRVVGIFDSFGASRNILNLKTVNETLLRGMTGTYSRTDELSSPAYLRCGKWWARYKETSGNSFVCFDAWPSTITPTAGAPILVYSEASALVREWLRVGLLFPYEPIDSTGAPSWMALPMSPQAKQAGGAYRIENQRTGRYPLFSVTLQGYAVTKPGLATP